MQAKPATATVTTISHAADQTARQEDGSAELFTSIAAEARGAIDLLCQDYTDPNAVGAVVSVLRIIGLMADSGARLHDAPGVSAAGSWYLPPIMLK